LAQDDRAGIDLLIGEETQKDEYVVDVRGSEYRNAEAN